MGLIEIHMSEENTEGTNDYEVAPIQGPVSEVRYSLAEMMEAVQAERHESALGRELVDSTEIEKMFSNRIRKKKLS